MTPSGRYVAYGAIVALLLYALYLGALFLGQAALIYPGSRRTVEPIAPEFNGAEPLRISTPAASIDALFLPPVLSTDASPKPIVVFGHGNGELIDDWPTAFQSFQERGMGVLLVEYPGYGRSTGAPSERSIRAAMDAAYDRIAADPRVDRARIVGFGRSLGGGAVCLLAKDRPLRALILESTFTSLDIFATLHWAPAFLLHDHFDNLATVRQFPGPVLVIHGRDDSLIPWNIGQQLASAAAHSTFRLHECGHGCWDPGNPEFWKDALPFLQQAGVLP